MASSSCSTAFASFARPLENLDAWDVNKITVVDNLDWNFNHPVSLGITFAICMTYLKQLPVRQHALFQTGIEEVDMVPKKLIDSLCLLQLFGELPPVCF